jgi:glycosyltransferase involved in cell wall biosynthesis
MSDLVPSVSEPLKVAMLLSCGSFEGFFGRVQGQTRESYLASYRGDWAWYYAAGLLANGIQPILYIPSLHESGRYETDTGIAVRFLPLARWYRPFEQVWPKRFSRLTRFTLYADERLNTIAFMSPLRAGLAEDGIDLLYVQEYWSGRFDHVVGRVGLPVAAADHGGLSRGVLTAFKRAAFARSAVIYSQTPDECEIARSYGAPALLQPNGCDTSQFMPGDPAARTKSVLLVSRLTNKQKRISDLIRAMALLPEDWTLDILGAGPDLDMLTGLAAELGLSPRITFHGFVGRDVVRERLRTCGVYAMPSSNEAVAIAALEAMGSGASVVLSRIRAFEMLVEDGKDGRLVPVGDPEALAAGILDAWENREARGRAAAETVRRRFDTTVLYRNLARSLREAAAQRNGDRASGADGLGLAPDLRTTTG